MRSAIKLKIPTLGWNKQTRKMCKAILGPAMHEPGARFACTRLVNQMSRCVLEGVPPERVYTTSFGGDVKPSVLRCWLVL